MSSIHDIAPWRGIALEGVDPTVVSPGDISNHLKKGIFGTPSLRGANFCLVVQTPWISDGCTLPARRYAARHARSCNAVRSPHLDYFSIAESAWRPLARRRVHAPQAPAVDPQQVSRAGPDARAPRRRGGRVSALRVAAENFKKPGGTHAAPDTHGDDHVLDPPSSALQQRVAHHPCTAHAVRVTDRNRPAIDV